MKNIKNLSFLLNSYPNNELSNSHYNWVYFLVLAKASCKLFLNTYNRYYNIYLYILLQHQNTDSLILLGEIYKLEADVFVQFVR